jgi:hypothetical protein
MELLPDEPSSLNVAEASRPNWTCKEDLCQKWGKVGQPREKEYKPAVLTNWMSPLLWHQINHTANCTKPQMQPTEIVKELKKWDSVAFGKLAPQTLGKWIERDNNGAHWSERTLERVTQANKPGGVTMRVGILVSSSESTILQHLKSNDCLLKCRLNILRLWKVF